MVSTKALALGTILALSALVFLSKQSWKHIIRRASPANNFQDIATELPNLPIIDWGLYEDKRERMFYKNATCAPYPSIFDVEFDSLSWQTLRTDPGTFFLYGAYCDTRDTPGVRILAMVDRRAPTRIYCQFWFENQNEPLLVETRDFSFIWYSAWGGNWDGTFQPYLVTCPLPRSSAPPASVSLVRRQCDAASNHLRVACDKPVRTKPFAVCVKGLDFPHLDFSVRLVEWLELLFLLGADRVFFYRFNVHPNVTEVLRYYERRGKAVVTPLTLPGGKPNLAPLRNLYLYNNILQKRLNEVIPYNDCLYRNLYSYDYITLLDVDEIIIPVRDSDWGALLRRLVADAGVSADEAASYNVRHVYFFDDMYPEDAPERLRDVPEYAHMLRHVVRASNYTPPLHYVKSFFKVSKIVTVHNHLPITVTGSVKQKTLSIDTADAKLHHFRKDCVPEIQHICHEFRKHTEVDTAMLKYKEALLPRVTRALLNLGFIQK